MSAPGRENALVRVSTPFPNALIPSRNRFGRWRAFTRAWPGACYGASVGSPGFSLQDARRFRAGRPKPKARQGLDAFPYRPPLRPFRFPWSWLSGTELGSIPPLAGAILFGFGVVQREARSALAFASRRWGDFLFHCRRSRRFSRARFFDSCFYVLGIFRPVTARL